MTRRFVWRDLCPVSWWRGLAVSCSFRCEAVSSQGMKCMLVRRLIDNCWQWQRIAEFWTCSGSSGSTLLVGFCLVGSLSFPIQWTFWCLPACVASHFSVPWSWRWVAAAAAHMAPCAHRSGSSLGRTVWSPCDCGPGGWQGIHHAGGSCVGMSGAGHQWGAFSCFNCQLHCTSPERVLWDQTWPALQKVFASKTKGKWLSQKWQTYHCDPSFLPSFFVKCSCLRCSWPELMAKILQQGCDGCSCLAPKGSQKEFAGNPLFSSRCMDSPPPTPSCLGKKKPAPPQLSLSQAPSASAGVLFCQWFWLHFQGVGLAAVSQPRFVFLSCSGCLWKGGGQGELGR